MREARCVLGVFKEMGCFDRDDDYMAGGWQTAATMAAMEDDFRVEMRDDAWMAGVEGG